MEAKKREREVGSPEDVSRGGESMERSGTQNAVKLDRKQMVKEGDCRRRVSGSSLKKCRRKTRREEGGLIA